MKKIFESGAFILFFLIFILANLVLALYFNLYYLIWWLDMVHHFLGGLWLAFLLNFYLKKIGFAVSNLLLLLILFLGFAALVGVLWEFTEFLWDRFFWHSGFTYFSGIYEDTLSDLFFDLLGGAVGFFLAL